MTTTPTFWGSSGLVNTSSVNFQGQHKTVGLSNGNYLVIYADDSGTVGTGAGRDIVGVIYGPTGLIVRTAYQLNTTRNAHEEELPSIAATNDGGFVMAYEDRDTNGQTLVMQRYNALGNTIDSAIIQNDPGTPTVSRPEVTVDQSDNSVFVSYQWSDGANDTVRGKAFDANLTVIAGTPINGYIIQTDDNTTNFSEGPFLGESATLTNGAYVTAHTEFDTDQGIEVRLSNGTTGANSTNQNVGTTGTNGVRDFDPQIAALTGGGFVVVWNEDEAANDNILFAIYNNAAVQVVAPTTVVDSGNNYAQPDVVALKDGGFFVAARDSTANQIEGTRYDAAGVRVGTSMFNMEDFNTPFSPELGLTSDGRIILSWGTSPAGDIRKEIWDPRDDVIVADGTEGVITARVTDDTDITGSGQGETILGQQGADTILGGFGDDSLSGGFGTDTVDYSYSFPPPFLALLNTWNIDLTTGTATRSSFGVVETDQLNSFENVIGSGWNDTITGNNGNNVLEGFGGRDSIFGGGSSDTLRGGDGNDTLSGGLGTDSIEGGADNDLIIQGDGENIDNVNGGSGTDTVDASDEDNFAITVDLGAGTWSGLGGTRSITNVEAVIGTQVDDVITGGADAEFFDGHLGSDNISAGSGNDTIADNLEGGTSTLNGNSGTDTLDLSGAAVGFVLNNLGILTATNGAVLDVASFDVLEGTGQADNIYEIASLDTINADAGNDTIRGNAQSVDFFDGQGGTDTYDHTGTGRVIDLAAGTSDGLNVLASIENYLGGTTGDDVLGTNGANLLNGRGGNDTLNGRGGNDTLGGGGGDDLFVYEGGWGTSDAYGGIGTDTVDFSAIGAGGGFLDIDLGTGIRIGAGPVNSTFNSIENATGSQRADLMTGTADDNFLEGQGANDTLNGMGGTDTLSGGGGDDLFVYELGWGQSNAFGGIGTDTVDFSAIGAGGGFFDIDLGTGITIGMGALNSTFSSIENATGTQRRDMMTGTAGDNLLQGGGDNDTLNGLGGTDTLGGGGGDDLFVYELGWGTSNAFGGIGTDTVDFSAIGPGGGFFGIDLSTGISINGGPLNSTFNSIENAIGSQRNDDMLGTNDDNFLEGKSGNDTVNGFFGDDTVSGGGGNDVLIGSAGDDDLYGGLGFDRFVLAFGEDVVHDFEDDIDTLWLRESIWGGGLTIPDVFSTYGSVVGGNTVLDFANGSEIFTIEGVTNVSTLFDDVVLF